MRWRIVGHYLALDRLRYPLAVICWVRRHHQFRFSQNEDATGYCALCNRWPVLLPPRSPEQIRQARERADEVARVLDWGDR